MIGSWNGHIFGVSADAIRGMEDLTVTGSVTTKESISDGQTYTEKKQEAAAEISIKAVLNRALGCRVQEEASAWVREAGSGASNYFYLAGAKLLPVAVMLVRAQISEIEMTPSGAWVSCTVDLDFKQSEAKKATEEATAKTTSSNVPNGTGSAKTKIINENDASLNAYDGDAKTALAYRMNAEYTATYGETSKSSIYKGKPTSTSTSASSESVTLARNAADDTALIKRMTEENGKASTGKLKSAKETLAELRKARAKATTNTLTKINKG